MHYPDFGVEEVIFERWVRVGFRQADMQILRTWQILRESNCHGFGGQG
jgi:hypothetical protein